MAGMLGPTDLAYILQQVGLLNLPLGSSNFPLTGSSNLSTFTPQQQLNQKAQQNAIGASGALSGIGGMGTGTGSTGGGLGSTGSSGMGFG